MALQTLYTVQAVVADGAGELKSEQPKSCKYAADAVQRARMLAINKLSVVAYSVSADAELGEYDEKPSMLFKNGRMPAEFDE